MLQFLVSLHNDINHLIITRDNKIALLSIEIDSETTQLAVVVDTKEMNCVPHKPFEFVTSVSLKALWQGVAIIQDECHSSALGVVGTPLLPSCDAAHLVEMLLNFLAHSGVDFFTWVVVIFMAVTVALLFNELVRSIRDI